MSRKPPSVLFYAELCRPFVPPDIQVRAMGGSETALLHVARGLAALGHQVTVVAHPGARQGIYDGVRYVDLEAGHWQDQLDVDVTVIFRQLPHVRRAVPGRYRLFWGHDHIGLYPELPRGIKRSVLTAAWSLGYRVFGQRAPGIVAVSRWLADCYVRFARWPSDHVWVIPNGVDPDLFQASNPVGSDAGDRPLRVAYTSVPERGLALLITRVMPAIWAQIPDVELHVFSYRPLDAYRALASSGGSRVVFHGGLPQRELARTLASYDLWLYPTDFPETSCIAAMEAQAAGLPVVTSARYALRETVEDGHTGILIEGTVGSDEYVERFASAAVRLLRDARLRREMGERARRRILTEFTWSKVAQRWSQLLHQVATEAGSHP